MRETGFLVGEKHIACREIKGSWGHLEPDMSFMEMYFQQLLHEDKRREQELVSTDSSLNWRVWYEPAE